MKYVALLAGALLVASLGCGCSQGVQTEDAAPEVPGVGDTVSLTEGARVTLVSATTRATASWAKLVGVRYSDEPRVWLSFDVLNASETTLAVPSQPAPIRVEAADGMVLEQVSGLVDRSDADSSSQRYLDPGDVLHALYELEPANPDLPLRVTWTPLSEGSAVFEITHLD